MGSGKGSRRIQEGGWGSRGSRGSRWVGIRKRTVIREVGVWEGVRGFSKGGWGMEGGGYLGRDLGFQTGGQRISEGVAV